MEDGRSHVLLAKVYSKMERPGDAITSLQQVNATACEWLCVSGCVWEVGTEGSMPHVRGRQFILAQLRQKITQNRNND